MAFPQEAVRRLSIVATETGLTAVNTKLREHERLQGQVATGAARMATATEAADRRMQALLRQRDRMVSSFNAGGVSGVGGSLASSAGMFAVSNVAPIVAGVAAVAAAYAALNMVWSRGAELLERYANAHRLVDRPDLAANLTSLTTLQQDTISAAQVQRATELGTRLADAKFTIDQFFKVHLDIVDPALKLQAAWVNVVEAIAAGATKLGAMFQMGPPEWLTRFLGYAVSGTPLGIAGLGVRGINALAGATPEAPTLEQSLSAARGRLASGLETSYIGREGAPRNMNTLAGRFGAAVYDLANPEKPDKPAAAGRAPGRDEFDRVTDSIRKQTEALEIQVATFGMSEGAAARYKIEQQLLNAATASGRELTDAQRATIRATADAYAAATEKLEQMSKAQEYANEFNNAMRDTFKGFVSDIRTGMQEGKEFWDVFGDASIKALNRISDKLLDMAINRLWEAAFPTKGAGGGLFNLFGTSMAGSGSQQLGVVGAAGGMAVPTFMHGGGIAGIDGTRRGYVHPAYFENAPRYHGGGMAGLAPDEVPAILQRGERVLARGQGGSSYAAPIIHNYGAAVEYKGRNDDGRDEFVVRGLIRDEIASPRSNGVMRKKTGTRTPLIQR